MNIQRQTGRKSISAMPSSYLHTHYECEVSKSLDLSPQSTLTRKLSSTEFSSSEFSKEDSWLSTSTRRQSSMRFSMEEYDTCKRWREENRQIGREFTMRDKGKGMMIDGIGNSWKIKGRIDSFGGRAILQENGEIIAVVISERSGRRSGYKLLGVTQLYPTQEPHSMTIKGQKLYEHVIVRKTSYFSNNFTILGLYDNMEYVTKSVSKFGPLQFKVHEKDSDRCCGYVRQYFERGDVSSSSWKVRVEKGINPKIMVCLTAIANKSMGKAV